MFSIVYTTKEEFKNATITAQVGFVFEENAGLISRDYRDVIVFKKALFSKCFPSTIKRRAGVFKSFPGRSFQKAPFLRNKAAAFSNFNAVAGTWRE